MLIRFIFILLVLVSCNLQAYQTIRVPLTIAIQEEGSQKFKPFLNETLKRLSTVNRKYVPEFVYFSVNQLQDPATLTNVDYLITSATVFSALEKYQGLKPIVSIQPSSSVSADHASSTAVLVQKNNKKISTLRDLINRNIGIPKNSGPDHKVHFSNELLIQGIKRPQKINYRDLPEDWTLLLSALEQGEVDALLVDPLDFKGLNLKEKDSIKVLEPRIKDEYVLEHTTGSYPGWVLGATLKPSRAENERLEMFLKSLPAYDGFQWSGHADYRQIHQILNNLNEPFYKSFRKKTWKELLYENRFLILLVVLLLLGWIAHTVFTNRLVNKKTKELSEANEQRLKTEEVFHNLEKASIVGQMSNIVAHELRQPLAAISNYSLAIKRRLLKGNLDEDALSFAIAKLLSESSRASDIIEHVQRYAKGKSTTCQAFSLHNLLQTVGNSYQNSEGENIILYKCPKELEFIGDPFEIELIVRNLIKNALDTVQEVNKAQIQVSAKPINNGVLLEVSDNGPKIPSELISNFFQPLKSTKIGGLGLGLSIVKRISEMYSGHVAFKQLEPNGLKVSVWLYNKDQGEQN